MLLLVDFAGPIRDRLRDQAALGVACCALICLGTLASRNAGWPAVAMAVVAFAVLFAGVVSSVLAGATTSLLLSFILPVSLAGAGVGDPRPGRRLGPGRRRIAVRDLAAVAGAGPQPVRGAAIEACRALAERLRAEVAYVLAVAQTSRRRRAHRRRSRAADEAVGGARDAFFATPYRPTGLTT